MNDVKLFYGKTANEALNKAEQALGDNATILSTKKVQSKTKGSFVYEVSALNVEETSHLKTTNKELDFNNDNNNNNNNNNNNASIEKILNLVEKKLEQKSTNEMSSMKGDFSELQKSIEALTHLVGELSISNELERIPPEAVKTHKLLSDLGFTRELSLNITNALSKLNFKEKELLKFLKKTLSNTLKIREEFYLPEGKKKITMLIGPTGVGKSTTVAKLAAKYKFSNHYNVGIITLDNYRIGAVEQIEYYSNKMEIPCTSIKEPNELIKAILKMKKCDIILIDTLGTSQYDLEKIKLISDFITHQPNLVIEKHLVIPSNVSIANMQDIFNGFMDLNFDAIIPSKIDETKNLGLLFSFLYSNKKPISYITTGQKVPEDILIDDGKRFVDLMFKKLEFIKKSKVKV
jgi:flagellar biosynthesis protein FlhF